MTSNTPAYDVLPVDQRVAIERLLFERLTAAPTPNARFPTTLQKRSASTWSRASAIRIIACKKGPSPSTKSILAEELFERTMQNAAFVLGEIEAALT